VVDDEPAFQETVARYSHSTPPYRLQWLEALERSPSTMSMSCSSTSLADTTGIKLLKEIRADRDDVEVIIITSHAEI